MDSQQFIINFVKIVEKYPVLYDNKTPNRTPHLCSLTWEKVADAVRDELHVECGVDELKSKWKGIRSSFARFKRKIRNKEKDGLKQYYLYETLQFLHPHTKNKVGSYSGAEKNDDQSSEGEEWDSEITATIINEDDFEHNNFSSTNELVMRTDSLVYPEVKIEPIDKDQIMDAMYTNDDNPLTPERDHAIKRKYTNSYDATTSKVQKVEENADLQFFKSILPDIEHFTKSEKRRFKMGVLNLIEDIENSRRDDGTVNNY